MELPSDERWTEINALLREAQAQPVEERAAFLREACGDDEGLRKEVDALLDAEATFGHVFDKGAAELVEALIPGVDQTAPRGGTPSVESGRQVGAYRLLERIGEGGTSIVYRAERADEQFERTVAVKILRRLVGEDEDTIARFRAEQQILASLSHPHLAEVYDGGVLEDGRPYLVMEYVEGRPITEHCRAEGLSIDERLRLFRQAAAAVQAAHEQLIVHRDLKPSNVFVERETGSVKLLDFGIAKMLGEGPGATTPTTKTGRQPMTPTYAAPEQVKGDAIRVATDTYALGVLLYELLTDVQPYGDEDRSPYAVARTICEEDPPLPSDAVDDDGRHDLLKGDLDAIIMKALRKEPGARYDTVDALAEDLDRYLADRPVRAHEGSVAYRAKKFARRNRRSLAAVAVAVVLFLGFAVYHIQRLSLERDEAQREAQKAEQVSDFLVELMQQTNPYGDSDVAGEDLTVRAVMDRGANRLDELDDQPAVQATMQNVIGSVYRELGLYEEAQPLLRQALEQRRRRADESTVAIGKSLHELGLYYQHTGDYEMADSLLREALAVRRATLPPQHPDLASTLAQLGNLQWYNFGNYTEADSLLHEALEIRRAIHDTSHVDLAASLNDLANLYHRRGEYMEAEPYYREAIQMYRDQLGVHANVAIVENNFAMLLRDMGKYEEAESRQREALEMHRSLVGEQSVDVALGQGNLARIYLRQGRSGQAVPLLEEALQKLRSRYEGAHPYTIRTLYHLGRAYLSEGRHADAEQLFHQAESQAGQAFPPDHPMQANPLLGLGRVRLAQNRVEEAEPLLRESLSIRRKAFDEDSWLVAEVKSVLGRCIAEQGQFDVAEDLLLQAVRTLEAERPSEDSAVQDARRYLADLYSAWNKPEQAEQYRSGSTEVRETTE